MAPPLYTQSPPPPWRQGLHTGVDDELAAFIHHGVPEDTRRFGVRPRHGFTDLIAVCIETASDVAERRKPLDALVRPIENRILTPCQQQHALPVPVGVQQNVVLEDEWITGVVLVRVASTNMEDAVTAQDLHVVEVPLRRHRPH